MHHDQNSFIQQFILTMVIYSSFEITLSRLPFRAKNVILETLDDTELLELQCTSRSIEQSIKQSIHYWRGLYGRTFHWKYVAYEEDFLLWYRNVIWRRKGRPIDSTIDFCGNQLEHAALQDINWRQVYTDRRKVEENWCSEGCYKELEYSGYIKQMFWHRYRGHISASNLLLKVNVKRSSMTTTENGDITTNSSSGSTFTERLIDISNFAKSVISMPSQPPHHHYYNHDYPLNSIRIIFTNGYYTGVDFNGEFFVRPTYSENDWLPIDVEGDLSMARIRTLGRWIIMTWDENASLNRVWNLSTGCSYKLPYYIHRIAFIMSATEDRITIFSYVPSVVLKSLDWRQYQLVASGRNNNTVTSLTTEKVRTGKFQCDHTYEECRLFHLGTEYVYAICGPPDNKCTLDIYTIGRSPSQKYICSFTCGRSAFRLNPRQAVVQFDDCYMIIDLSSGDAIHFIDLDGMPNCCPIIGRIMWCHGKNGGQVRDIYSGEPCGFTIDKSNDDDNSDNNNNNNNNNDQDSNNSSSFVICSTFCISVNTSNNHSIYHFNVGTLFDTNM
jgi:hypothetical protein